MDISSLLFTQAERDLKLARFLFHQKSHRRRSLHKEWIIFCSQQAAEKALKAVLHRYPPQHTQRWKKEHNFRIFTGALHGGKKPVPKALSQRLRAFHEVDQRSRYPDIFKQLPSDIYTWKDVRNFLKTSKDVLSWAKKILK